MTSTCDWLNANHERLGLKKLNIDTPYKAPPGAIVVVRPGTPGTAHPTAGDIVVAGRNNHFYNGGEMGYGGPQNFPRATATSSASSCRNRHSKHPRRSTGGEFLE